MTDHIARMFEESVRRYPDRPATRIRVGDSWIVHTYAELSARVHATAKGLLAAGIQPGDRVAIFSNDLPEWTEVDFATLFVRAVPVPIYATSTPDQIAHIVNDSGTRFIFAGGQSEVDRVRAASTPGLERIVSLTAIDDPVVVGLPTFRHQVAGREDLDAELQQRLADASPDDLASIIYTSGTTGAPKGVMLPHRALTAQVHALDQFFDIRPEDHSLCFLPLSHALERGWSMVVFSHGCMNTYVPNAKRVAEMMVLAQPTLMVSVPKLYEKVFATAREKVAGSHNRQRIFDWAIGVGAEFAKARHEGRHIGAAEKARHALADRLVLHSIRDAMGGPKTVLASGGAPLRKEIEEFFAACGLLVFQGYGLTEAGPLVSFNAPSGYRFGTAGRVMPGGDLRIADDGEILYHGPNVMTGYWNSPETTEATFTEIDGKKFLRTGDVGEIDTDGYLHITDRIKDIIVTLNGKNISPQPIEGLLLADSLFEHAVLLGDNRPCLTLLVTPSLPDLTELAKHLDISFTAPSELLGNQQIVEEVRRRAQSLTAKLPNHEQIRDLRVLLEDFTMDNGLLTPTLKVKRREVEKRFQHLVDDMYAKIAERRARGKDDPAPSDHTGTDHPASDHPANDHTGSDHPGSDDPGSDHPGSDHPAAG